MLHIRIVHSILKWEGVKIDIFQRRHENDQQTHEKILNVTNHQRSANKTTMRYHFTPVRMAIIKKTKNYRCWQGCGKKEILYIVGNANWSNHYGKQYFIKLKIELPYNPAIPLLGIYKKEMKTGF